MEENRSLEPETLEPTSPAEGNAPAAGAPEKRKLPGKKLGAISTAGSKLRGRANKSDKQESKYLED